MGLHQFFGKHEQLSVGILTIFFFLFAFSIADQYYGFISPVYEKITIKYQQENQDLIIHETFTIDPKGKNYHVLYRSFAEPICFEENCNLQIQQVTCQTGKPYLALRARKPLNPSTKEAYKVSSFLANKIESNEVGCFLESETYAGKQERLTITYKVPLLHVENNQYNHYLFSEKHLPIHKLEVQGLEKTTTAAWLPGDRFVMINVKNGEINEKGFPLGFALLLVFLFSSLPFGIWYLFGREKTFVVPEYLHTIPDPSMEPWQVDVLTNGTLMLSKEGMASILMELYVNKVMEFSEQKKMGIFKEKILLIAKNASIDNLSAKARSFYYLVKKKSFKEDEQYFYCDIPKDPNEMRYFFQDEDIRPFTKKIIDKKGYYIFYVAVIALFIFYFYNPFIPKNIYAMAIGFIMLFKMSFMKIVFSRFKDDYYKTYLEWLAFKNMLMDFAQIQKYFKEDYQQWKEWLLYATALGAAENVIKAMKELRLFSPEAIEHISRVHSTALIVAHTTYAAGYPRGSSGGIGSGGGFGGGGGGGR